MYIVIKEPDKMGIARHDCELGRVSVGGNLRGKMAVWAGGVRNPWDVQVRTGARDSPPRGSPRGEGEGRRTFRGIPPPGDPPGESPGGIPQGIPRGDLLGDPIGGSPWGIPQGSPGRSPGDTPGVSGDFYSRVAQSDLPTPAPGSLRISPRPQMEGGRLGEGPGKVFMGFYIIRTPIQNIAKIVPNQTP